LATLPLCDAYTIASSRVGPVATFGGNRRIDYIFLRGSLGVSTYEVIESDAKDGVAPSDHLPIVTRMMWK
jgi:endonuclease/exonuclease/phosphatase family metal-dependent hydrolase